jgi:hypothetical protein
MTEQQNEDSSESSKEEGVLKRTAIKIKHGEYIEVFLRKGTLESNNHATYLDLAVFLNGKRYSVNITKAQASQLTIILLQLIMEGNNIDYEVLKRIYPDQKSWHIY